jgi:hypothetical protein
MSELNTAERQSISGEASRDPKVRKALENPGRGAIAHTQRDAAGRLTALSGYPQAGAQQAGPGPSGQPTPQTMARAGIDEAVARAKAAQLKNGKGSK